MDTKVLPVASPGTAGAQPSSPASPWPGQQPPYGHGGSAAPTPPPQSSPLANRLGDVPPAPRALSARARQLVTSYQGTQGVKLTVGLVAGLAALVPCTVVGVDIFAIGCDMALSVAGTSVPGTVTGVETVKHTRVNRVYPKDITFRYRVDGHEHTATSRTLDYALAARYAPGTSITVETLSFLPSLGRASGTLKSNLGYVGLLFGFVFLFPFVGLGFALSAFRENQREKRAFIHGSPALAQVVSRGLDRSAKVNGRHPTEICWQLHVAGQRYEGSYTTLEPHAVPEAMTGQELIVLYDPENPATNTLWVWPER